MPTCTRPNVLLITTDQQRSDTLGVNGNTLVRTPNMDSLARGGVNFQQAFVQNTVCIPSRACIQTGRYTHQHGVEYMEEVIDDTPGLPAWEITFMERLQAAGYRTAAYGKLHMMPHKGFHEMHVCGGKGARWIKSAGLDIGLGPLGRDYAAWLEARHPGAYEMIYQQRRQPEYEKYHTAISNVLPLDEYVDTWIAQNTIDYLKRPHERPFFAWCGFCGPHDPMDPPSPYDKMYPYDDIPLHPNYNFDLDRRPRPTSPEEDAVVRRWMSHYFGQITLIDDAIGRIIDTLRAQDLLKDTLIILASDHGEMMFEFGKRHKAQFNEGVIRVPLIVAPPGAMDAKGTSAGRNVQDVVEIYDIAPTVLDYADAEVPSSMSASSLRPIIEGRGGGRQMALSQYVTGDRKFRGVCVRTQSAKYTRWTDSRGEEFYDIAADPLERNNLIDDPKHKAEIDRHRMLLIDRLTHTGAKMC